jgi:uncharacterized protein (DUF4213/DUF364 family)
MKILEDILTPLRRGESVLDVRQGPFQTAVLTGGCGLAATPHDTADHQHDPPVKSAGALLGWDALGVAGLAYSASHFEAAIGLATINSLLEVDEERCREVNARDLLLERGSGKPVALVGHFPFVEELKAQAKKLWVLERRLREGDFPETEAEKLLSRAEVVGISGMAFTNHTIEGLLGYCRPDAYVVIMGGTTPLSPVLFDYGVDAIAGVRVVDPKSVLDAVSQGATFRQIKGVRLLTMTK